MIDSFFMILKKSMILLMFIVVGFVTTYVPQLQHEGGYANVEVAHAGSVTFDPIDFIYDTLIAIKSAAMWVLDKWSILKEKVLDGIAWGFAKNIIARMTADIVDWINSGFEGRPAFVTDFKGLLLEAADEEIGRYINELGGLGSFVCSPFRLDVQLAIAFKYELKREDRPAPECTLSGILDNATDFKDYIAGDFERGGWGAWFELVAQPSQTPTGAILTAEAEYRARIVNAEGEEITKAGWGDGFLSIPVCEDAVGADGDQEQCIITKPGRVLADQLNKALSSDTDQLVAADEFNEIFTALVGQLVTTAIDGENGLLGLSGGTGYTYSGYPSGSFISQLETCTNPEGCQIDPDVDTIGISIDDPDTTTSTTSSPGGDWISDTVAALENFVADLDYYEDAMIDFIANPLNSDENKGFANVALAEIEALRDRMTSDVADAIPLAAQYAALETEHNDPDTTPARRAEIRAEQAEILTDFSELDLVTTTEMDILKDRWDSLLDLNVESVSDPDPDICDTDPWAPGCPCDINPSLPICSAIID